MPQFAANLSFLFSDAPFEERFLRASAAGFRGVEYLFPYDWPAHDVAEWLKAAAVEQVLQTVVVRVNAVDLGAVSIVDSTGDALPRHVASYPATVRKVLEELYLSTGVDIPGILSGNAHGVGRNSGGVR